MGVSGWEGTDAVERHRLLLRMTLAAAWGDRRYADRVLVEATRFLKRQGGDPVILEARECLRSEFPPAR